MDRSYFIRNKQYEPFFKNWKKPIQGFQNLNINVLNHTLNKNYEKIKLDLENRFEWPGKAKIILMNFAIHYLCDDINKIKKLGEFIKSVLQNDGIFVLTYFDGDYIYEHRKENIGPYKIKIVKQDKNTTIAKMPLPTIQAGDDIYREEPLAHSDILNNLDKYLTLDREFYVYDETETIISRIKNSEKYIDYFKLVKCRIYKQKSN